MTGSEILEADLLDIVFDTRNKQYGAYTLRKYYHRRITLALFLSIFSVLFFLLLIRPSGIEALPFHENKEVTIKTVVFPQMPEKPDNATIHSAGIPRIPVQPDLLHIHMVDNIKIKLNEMALPDALHNKGIPDIISDFPGTVSPDGSHSIINAELPSVQEKKQEVMPLHKEPEFPGGLKAWITFLYSNLKSPENLDPGEKRTVMIRFQISAEGAVTGFSVVQSAGDFYDNEVLRVLKLMPRWKPAVRNGHSIAVYFTQPVTFMGPEQ